MPLNEVDIENIFSHRVLDLQAGVHLQKEKFTCARKDKLDRTGSLVAHGVSCLARGVFKCRLQFIGDMRGRRLFEDFLMATLNTAITQTQHRGLTTISNNLDFNMARFSDPLFNQHITVTEST